MFHHLSIFDSFSLLRAITSRAISSAGGQTTNAIVLVIEARTLLVVLGGQKNCPVTERSDEISQLSKYLLWKK